MDLLCTVVIQTTPTVLQACSSHGSWPMFAPTEQENSLTASNGGPTWPEDRFSKPIHAKEGEMAHPVLTKGILQLSPEAAMLPGPRVETHPPPPVPPFLLAQNLSPKDIARSDITS